MRFLIVPILLLFLFKYQLKYQLNASELPSFFNEADIPVYLDAKQGEYDETKGTYKLEGGVALIYKDYFLYASSINWSVKKNSVEAIGNVVLIYQNNLFVGEKLRFDLSTRAIDIWKAHLYLNSIDTKIFKEEVFFLIPREIKKLQKINAIAVSKKRSYLLDKKDNIFQYYDDHGFDSKLEELFEEYLILKEEIDKISKHRYSISDQQSEEERKQILQRITYLRSVKEKQFAGKPPRLSSQGYLYLKGKHIQNVAEHEYIIRDGYLTTCVCGANEVPAWQFSGKEIKIRVEGYATFKHSVLLVNNVPTVYFPWMKLPVKTQRQSGLLAPVFKSHRKHTGFAYGMNYYWAINEYQDATFGYEYFQRLGHRFSGEYRYSVPGGRGGLFMQGIKDRYMGNTYQELLTEHKESLLDSFLSKSKSHTDLEIEEFKQSQDNKYPDLSENRYFVLYDHNQMFDPHFTLKSRVRMVSDHLYFYHLEGMEREQLRFLPTYVSLGKSFTNVYTGLQYKVLDDLNMLNTRDIEQKLPDIQIESLYQPIVVPGTSFTLPFYYAYKVRGTRFNRLGGTAFNDSNGKYYEADRLDGGLELYFPLPKNDYVTGNIFIQGNSRTYNLPFKKGQARQSYLSEGIKIKVPLDKRFKLPIGDVNYHFEHTVVPGISWTYIPKVNRDDNYSISMDPIDSVTKKNLLTLSLSTGLSLKKEQWIRRAQRITEKKIRKKRKLGKTIFDFMEDENDKLSGLKGENYPTSDNPTSNYPISIVGKENDVIEFDKVDNVNKVDGVNVVNEEDEEDEGKNKETSNIDPSIKLAQEYHNLLNEEEKGVISVVRNNEISQRKSLKKQKQLFVQEDYSEDIFRDYFYKEFPEKEHPKLNTFDEAYLDAGSWGLSSYQQKTYGSFRPILLDISQPINVDKILNRKEKKAEEDKKDLSTDKADGKDEIDEDSILYYLEKAKIRLWVNMPSTRIYIISYYDHNPKFNNPFSETTATFKFLSPYFTALNFAYTDHRTMFTKTDSSSDVNEEVEGRIQNITINLGFNLLRTLNLHSTVKRQLRNEFVASDQSLKFSFKYSPATACWGIMGYVEKHQIGSMDLSYELKFLLNFNKDYQHSYTITKALNKLFVLQ